MGRVHTPSVISPALRWGTIAVVLAASLAIAMTRMCRAVTIPAKAEPPAMSGGATDVLKTASATAESWRAGIERDAQTVGVATPTDTEMTKKLTYRLDDEARVIAPGEGALEVAGLRLTASAVNEAGSSRQAMILTVENLTDTALAYNVVTTPRPGGAACNQRTILGHDAIVVAAGGKQVRSECVYRPGMSLAIARVETPGPRSAVERLRLARAPGGDQRRPPPDPGPPPRSACRHGRLFDCRLAIRTRGYRKRHDHVAGSRRLLRPAFLPGVPVS